MPITRSSLKTGPAIVTYNGATLYFKQGLKITETIETFNIDVDAFGKVDERVQDRNIVIAGVPAGEWEHLTVLYPWLDAAIGTRAHGDVDVPLVVHAIDGTRYTYHNAALTQMPALRFAATETLLGEVQWTARVKDNTEPTAADSIFTRGTSAFTHAGFSLANIKTQPYTLNWGASPWDSFRTVDGVTVNFETSWSPLTVDGYGVLDNILGGINVSASFRPLNVTQAAIDTKLALQAVAGAAQGSSLAARGTDLVITGTDVHVIIRAAAAKSAAQEFGLASIRNGELQAVATRTFASGVPVPLAYVGTAAPT
jgi:hypothetical protein